MAASGYDSPTLEIETKQKNEGADGPMDKAEILALRKALVGPNVTLHHAHDPLLAVRGEGQYLINEEGERFLDAQNNVAHVGHGNKHVAKTVGKQLEVLNTNSRYLHPTMARYAKRLLATLPEELCVVYFVNSGSEANDLALRLARAHTKHEDVVVVDHAYHGHTQTVVQFSPYKYEGSGGHSQKDWVHKVPLPDAYRGPHRGSWQDEAVGKAYAADAGSVIDAAVARGRKVAAFYCESMISCGGQVIPPKGYLKDVFERVRRAGGVCISDEVQVGFGRVGSHFWAFQAVGASGTPGEQGAVPDIVTMGKPMGNGFPVAAVVTTRAVATSFDNGMSYFNTYGGNPASLSAAMAVMDEIDRMGLVARARTVGAALLKGVKGVQADFPGVVGDVRGLGLFVGVDLVESSASRRPSTELGRRVALGLRARKVLVSRDGPAENVLKFKPPMVFTEENAAEACVALRGALQEACEAMGLDPKVGNKAAKDWVPTEELAVDLDSGANVGSEASGRRKGQAQGGAGAGAGAAIASSSGEKTSAAVGGGAGVLVPGLIGAAVAAAVLAGGWALMQARGGAGQVKRWT